VTRPRPSLITRFGRSIGAIGLALWLGPSAARAQDSTGTLLVRVHRLADSTPVSGAFVRSGRVAATTDIAGAGRIELLAKLSSVTVSHPSFESQTFEMTIEPNVTQRADIYLRPGDQATVIQATRVGARVSEEPLAVALFDQAAVTDALARHPGDLTGFFPEPAMRLQPLSGALDASRLRLKGLAGQYHALLIDGLPLLGGRPGSFGLGQIGLSDIAGAEVVTGAATSLHGPVAGSGVVNLISRRPDRNRLRLGLDQTSEKGGDVFLWGSRRPSPTLGVTLAADFHQQRLVDADDDAWGELPRAIRFSVRPRLYLDSPNGDGVMATVGAMSEDRTGGFLNTNTDPNPYREERQTRRFDLALAGHRLEAEGGRWELNAATVFQSTGHRFGPIRERDRRSFLFVEGSYRRPFGRTTVVAGLGYQREALRQQDFPAFDYTHSVPTGFGRVITTVGGQTVIAIAARCDQHNVHGTQCRSSGAVLIRPNAASDLRIAVGEGYVSPTPLTDEVVAVGLHATFPVTAKAERFQTASVDWRTIRGEVEFSAAVALSRVALPVRLIPLVGDTADRLRLINVEEPTRIFWGELAARWHRAPVSGRAYYAYLNGSEGVPEEGRTGRRALELAPRHTLGVDLSWTGPGPATPTVTLETAVVGAQSVYDNPTRTRTPAYPRVGGLASFRSGRARLFLSGENLLGKTLRDYQPVVLTTLLEGGRRTTAPWIPLRGRVINIGAVVDW
jgi:hypothetical protein